MTTTPTTPDKSAPERGMEVGQEISLFDCRWKIEGIHLGALGQESLVELKSLTHSAGWTGQWEYHPMVFVPEPFVRIALTNPAQETGQQDAEGTYDGWKAKSPAHAIVRMLQFHGDKPADRIVEIERIIRSAEKNYVGEDEFNMEEALNKSEWAKD